MKNIPIVKAYGYFWVTLLLFLLSLSGHWMSAWVSYQKEQQEHNQPIVLDDYVTQTVRDTLENWQSEFLQLMWQVAGLAYLWHVGSPQSKEGDDRKEEKLDEILRLLSPKKAEKFIKEVDKKYPRTV